MIMFSSKTVLSLVALVFMMAPTVNARLGSAITESPHDLSPEMTKDILGTMTRELQNTWTAQKDDSWQGNDGDNCQNWVSKGDEPVDHCTNCKSGKGTMWNDGQSQFSWKCGIQPVQKPIQPASIGEKQCNGQGTFVPADLMDLCCDGAQCDYNGFCRCA
jgi:hypothetical protein